MPGQTWPFACLPPFSDQFVMTPDILGLVPPVSFEIPGYSLDEPRNKNSCNVRIKHRSKMHGAGAASDSVIKEAACNHVLSYFPPGRIWLVQGSQA